MHSSGLDDTRFLHPSTFCRPERESLVLGDPTILPTHRSIDPAAHTDHLQQQESGPPVGICHIEVLKNSVIRHYA